MSVTARDRELIERDIEAYLDALTARNQGDPEADDLVRSLRAGLETQDPRRRLLEQSFGA